MTAIVTTPQGYADTEAAGHVEPPDNWSLRTQIPDDWAVRLRLAWCWSLIVTAAWIAWAETRIGGT